MLVCGFAQAMSLPAQTEGAAAGVLADSPKVPSSAEDRIGATIAAIVLEWIPHDFTEQRDWGKTRRVVEGLGLRREGLRVETYRRWREVNHGTWEKVTVRLVDPEQRFQVELKGVHPAGDKVAFDLFFHTPLAITARQSKWVNGVQLYSVSADASADVTLRVGCQLAVHLDYRALPPDVVLEPSVSDAGLKLRQFRIHRVSKLGGEFAQQATRWAREPLERRIEERNQRIVDKLNAQIEKHRHEFRISLSEALRSRWHDLLAPGLGERGDLGPAELPATDR
jgi:hypothetical protein